MYFLNKLLHENVTVYLSCTSSVVLVGKIRKPDIYEMTFSRKKKDNFGLLDIGCFFKFHFVLGKKRMLSLKLYNVSLKDS